MKLSAALDTSASKTAVCVVNSRSVPWCSKRAWLRCTEFHYPEGSENLPSLEPLENWPKFNPRDMR
jgi:hypothetical protein